MAGSSATLDWGGFDTAIKAGIEKLASGRQQMNAEIGEMLVTSVKQRFKDEKGPDGKAWEPSKRDGKTLTDTARLKNSIGYEATSDLTAVGSNVVYARIHQKGGETGRGHAVNLLARPFLGINEEDQAEAAEIIRDFIAEPFT
ncbi:MAG: phage virion morphogenesis protein [Magnetococcales bacterium]|nr:phage virion morphogenesis protein [Magnetococcales bacterium]